jgi:hypothetical protein
MQKHKTRIMKNIEKLGLENWFKDKVDLAISAMVRPRQTQEGKIY